MICNIAGYCRRFLVEHERLRRDKPERAILLIERVSSRGRISLAVQSYYYRAGPTDGAQSNRKLAVLYARRIRHIPHGDDRPTQKRHKSQAKQQLPDSYVSVRKALSIGVHASKYITTQICP